MKVLNDLVEILSYNVKRARMHELDEETLKYILLKSIIYEWIYLLNLVGKRDVSQVPFGEICDLCKHISRGNTRSSKTLSDPDMSRVRKFSTGLVSRGKLRNFHDKFKTNIIVNISEKLDTLKIKNKRKDENVLLSILCPRYMKKHDVKNSLMIL